LAHHKTIAVPEQLFTLSPQGKMISLSRKNRELTCLCASVRCRTGAVCYRMLVLDFIHFSLVCGFGAYGSTTGEVIFVLGDHLAVTPTRYFRCCFVVDLRCIRCYHERVDDESSLLHCSANRGSVCVCVWLLALVFVVTMSALTTNLCCIVLRTKERCVCGLISLFIRSCFGVRCCPELVDDLRCCVVLQTEDIDRSVRFDFPVRCCLLTWCSVLACWKRALCWQFAIGCWRWFLAVCWAHWFLVTVVRLLAVWLWLLVPSPFLSCCLFAID
jgi:hypothetical protein